jgi:hypothetical protein
VFARTSKNPRASFSGFGWYHCKRNYRMKICFVAGTACLMAIFSSVQLTAQPIIQSVRPTNSNTQLRFDADGVSGAFVVERANLVNDPWCAIAALSQRSNVVTGVDGPQAFFRVRDLSNAPITRLTVSLSGAAEIPPVTTTSDGFGTLEINGDTLKFDIAFRNLSSASTLAHIHGPATATGSAAPMIDLAAYAGLGTTNGRIAGSLILTAGQKANILAGMTYVNVHSANNGGGEIRGQVTPTTFRVVMSAVAERPPKVSPAYGLGALTLIGNQLTYDIVYQGLTGPATLAHIHGPAGMGGTAIPLFDLIPVGGFGRAGVLSGRTNLTPAQIAALVDGRAYANIHTAANGSGEIRGQVLPFLGEAPFAADLTGAAERPPVTTSGTGFVMSWLHSNQLFFAAMYHNLSSPATLAHIHGPAPSSGTAAPMFDIASFHRGPFSTQGVFMGSITLSSAQVSNLINGDLYMNIHTVNNGGGEIRGQLCHTIFPVSMNGTNEPTPVAGPGTAFGYVGLLGRQFSVGLHYRDLTSVANNAHLHGPGTTNQSVGTLININNANYTAGGFSTNGFLIGSQTTTDTIVGHIVDFLTYINIHTGNNPNGEIRGQVWP